MTTFHVSMRDNTARFPGTLTLMRSLLRSELAEQTESAARSRATIAALGGQPDLDSRFERELAGRSAALADRAIARIRHALGRIDAGTYGTCETCGDPIPFERLKAIPYTSWCVGCPAPPGATGLN